MPNTIIRIRAVIYASILALLCSISSCELLGQGLIVEINLPDIPEPVSDRFAVVSYTIEYTGPDGALVTSTVTDITQSIAIEVSRGRVVPIVGRPVVHDIRRQNRFPAYVPRLVCGAVITCEEALPTVVLLQWIDGCVAEFLLSYLAGGSAGGAIEGVGMRNDTSDGWFGARTLMDAAIEVSDGNPWNIDLRQLSVAFEEHFLTKSVVRAADMHIITVEAMKGVWRYLDPLNTEPVIGSLHGADLSLPRGYHVLYACEGLGVTEISVGKYEWTAVVTDVNPDRVDIESGIL